MDGAETRPIVAPSPGEPKSGCLWCPLLPFSGDFQTLEKDFGRNPDTFLKRVFPEGHLVRNRCVHEEWTNIDLLVVGDAPGADEDRLAQAFVTRAGKLLRLALQEHVGLPLERVGFTHLVRCRPPRNRDPNNTEVKSCSPALIREIQVRKPKLVMVLGNAALKLLTGNSGITMLAGSLLDCSHAALPGVKVLANVSPGYVLRMTHWLEPFLEVIEKAGEFLRGEHVALQGDGEYFVLDTVEAVRTVIEAALASDDYVAIDTECGSLSPHDTENPQLLCVSLTDEEGFGYVIPYDHVDSPWHAAKRGSAKKREAVAGLMRTLLLSPVRKVFQNEKFDRKHLFKAFGVETVNAIDTMLIHMLLDEKQGTHGLKVLAHTHTGMGGYDEPLEHYKDTHAEADPDKGGSFANIPGEVLFPYAGRDADVTLRVLRRLLADPEFVSNAKFQALALVFFPQLSAALAHMEYDGVLADVRVAEALAERYAGRVAAADEALMALPEVQAFCASRDDPFNPGSDRLIAAILFDHYREVPLQLTDTGLDRLRYRLQKAQKAHAKERKGKRPQFESIVKDAIKRKEWALFSTKAEVLQAYKLKGNPFAQLILTRREESKALSTYVAPLLRRKVAGCDTAWVHCSFLISGTVTGRLASVDPNLQNQSNKDEGVIKCAYVSRFGDEGVFLQGDYSQVELRLSGCWYEEPLVIEAYQAGADLHTLTAADIAFYEVSSLAERMRCYLRLPDEEQKEWRSRAKRINFGVLYGGGPGALQRTLAKDGIFLDIPQCRELIDRYFEARPGLRKALDRTEQEVLQRGYLDSFSGRRRRIPEVASDDLELVARALRQACNHPIQSGAGEITLMALTLLDQRLRAEGYRSRVVLTVHDSIIVDCHVDEVFEVALMQKEVMEGIRDFSESVLPGLDWSWLTVPLVADFEMGFSWGSLVKFNPCDYDVDALWAAMESKHASKLERIYAGELVEAT